MTPPGTKNEPCPFACGYYAQTGTAMHSHVLRHHPEEMAPVRPVVKRDTGKDLRPTRCAIYLRVSTIDQNPESQLNALNMWITANGFTVANRPNGQPAVYTDYATGKNLNRPELQALIKDSYSRTFDCVVFLRLSRLGRNLKHNIDLFDHFEQLNIALIAIAEPVDTRSSAGRFIRNVLASVHEYMRELIIEQAKEGIAVRRMKGLPLGRHPKGCGRLYKCPWGTEHHSEANRKRRESRAQASRQKFMTHAANVLAPESRGPNDGDLSQGKADQGKEA